MINGEKHHIKPRSLYPELTKDKDNIVKLTYKEHYVCHHLLYKMYEELNDKNSMHKMACAWFRMCKNTDGMHVTKRQYEIVKTTMATLKRGMHLSEEAKKKMSEALKGKITWIKGRITLKSQKRRCLKHLKEKLLG